MNETSDKFVSDSSAISSYLFFKGSTKTKTDFFLNDSFNLSESGDFRFDSLLETYVSSSSDETVEQLPGPALPDMFDVKEIDIKGRQHESDALKIGPYDLHHAVNNKIMIEKKDACCQTDITLPWDVDMLKVYRQRLAPK